MTTDHRHGSAYDRGGADRWYGREPVPHMFEGASYNTPEIPAAKMTPQQRREYFEGYLDGEPGKDWGDGVVGDYPGGVATATKALAELRS